MVLLNIGASSLAKILAGTKTADLDIDIVQLDTTYNNGVINASDTGATTPTTPNPVTAGLKSQTANVMTVSFSISPANNIGIWRRWWLHFKADLTEVFAAGVFTNPGIDHDGTKTDVVEFDIAFIDG